MSKVLYVVDTKNKNYKYKIDEDTIIYHFSINSSSNVTIDLVTEGVSLNYYYNNINYDDNEFNIKVNHKVSNTHSELFNHGVNVKSNKLTYYVLEDKYNYNERGEYFPYYTGIGIDKNYEYILYYYIRPD